MTTESFGEPNGATYDFIVCGGGTSGCVVASRLSENPNVRVLLLEAGGSDDHPQVRDSTVWMQNIGSDRDWQYRALPSPSLNQRSAILPMGKVLGGGSSINGLVWARGHKHDFDTWAELTGDPGWSYDAVVDLYKRIEDWDGPPNTRLRGKGGPVYVTLPKDPVPLTGALIEAAAAQGIPKTDDLNAETMERAGGCGIANVTVSDGIDRVSMATAYIHPHRDRPNLTLLLGAEVTRLILNGTRVTGVEFIHGGKARKASATGEVVLSLGAINTPKVLMLSGIGDEAELAKHSIPVRQHLPGVGQNFQDHILLAGCIWEYVTPEAPRNNSAEFTLFCKSDPSLPAPDLQPILEEAPFASEVTAGQYDVPQARDRAWTLAPGLVRPKSRGHIALTGNRPQDPLVIHANFLSEEADLKALMTCVELCREIGNAPALRPFVKREVMPGPLKGADLVAFIRNAAGTYFHETCTAKMGRDAMSVVDGSLKVYGIDGLRVADGSVMPFVTTGNTMAPCAMIGERAADLLKKENGID